MFARTASVLLPLWTFLLLVGSVSGQEIHLKSGDLKSGVAPKGRAPMQPGKTGYRHLIVQFDHPPNSADIAALAKAGVRMVAAMPDHTLMVSAPENVQLPPGVNWAGALQVREKMSAELSKDGWNAAVVEFHGDVALALQNEIGNEEGFSLARNSRLRSDHALAYGTYDELTALAGHDEVAYIFPAHPALAGGGEIHACAGMLTQSGPVAQYSNVVHGWDLDSDQIAHLSYLFGDMTNKLPSLPAQAEIARALLEWAKNAGVSFHQGTDPAAPRTIFVKFATGTHGDPFPFDGPGGVLAHTFYPVPVNGEPIAGDMHLDADENWHIGGDIDLYSVALHEAGHAIGLGHSDKPGDVMYPYYRTGMRLTANDIGAAQQLYGVASAAVPPITADPVPAPDPTPVAPSPVSPTPSPATPIPAPVLTIAALPGSVTVTSINVAGTLTGGTSPVNVTWQTDHGSSGSVSLDASGSWSLLGVALQPGLNQITVNAMDGAHRSVTKSVSVTLSIPASPIPGAPGAPLTLAIQNPAGAVVTTSQLTITLSGIASGGSGVNAVIWQNALGVTGSVPVVAGHWTASDIPLLVGTNNILVKAADSSGASTWCTIVAVRH